MYIYIYIYTHAHVYMYVYIHMYIYIYYMLHPNRADQSVAVVWQGHRRRYIYTHTHICIYVCVCIYYTHTHTYTYIHIHTYVYTYIIHIYIYCMLHPNRADQSVAVVWQGQRRPDFRRFLSQGWSQGPLLYLIFFIFLTKNTENALCDFFLVKDKGDEIFVDFAPRGGFKVIFWVFFFRCRTDVLFVVHTHIRACAHRYTHT